MHFKEIEPVGSHKSWDTPLVNMKKWAQQKGQFFPNEFLSVIFSFWKTERKKDFERQFHIVYKEILVVTWRSLSLEIQKPNSYENKTEL